MSTTPDDNMSTVPQTPNGASQPKEEPTEDIQVPETPTPVTPKKRGRKKKITTTPAENKTTKESVADSDGSPTKKPKAATTPSKTSCGPIPTSLEAASLTDKMILRMRDEENRNWTDITNAWVALTGTKVGNSTLRMRYTTMKANFVSIATDDEPRLLKAKKDVEERFEQEKWPKIAEAIEADGGQKYPHLALQKKFKELSKKNGAAVDAAADAAEE